MFRRSYILKLLGEARRVAVAVPLEGARIGGALLGTKF